MVTTADTVTLDVWFAARPLGMVLAGWEQDDASEEPLDPREWGHDDHVSGSAPTVAVSL